MKLKLSHIALIAVGIVSLAATFALAGPRRSAGECGEYKYSNHGKCEDARNKKADTTWSSEILSRHWKP
jgi:hypothetical protein